MYNRDIHHRRSIRLSGYDYSRHGAYFVTICTQDRECLFGGISDGEMVLNEAGTMIEKWRNELINKFSNIELDQDVIMPNHLHGIIMICKPQDKTVGTDLRVCPEIGEYINRSEHTGSPLRMKKNTISHMVQWFKTMTTNEYIRHVRNDGWKPFKGKLWQRNFHERVIRNEDELNRIREYILNNPLKWHLDRDNPTCNSDENEKKFWRDFS